jgi:hypothetical protein
MPTLDVTVSADLQKLFELPECAEVRLPLPEKLEITLPTGALLKAIADTSKGIPNDCSLIVSLLLQIAPFLASFECLFKLLGMIDPLIKVVEAIKNPPELLSAVPKFMKAAGELSTCLEVLIPALGLTDFARDLLCLILKALHCLIEQLTSIIDIMNGLTLRINIAKASGNIKVQQALECAQENAIISAQHASNSIEPISAILKLAGPLLGVVPGLPSSIELPALGSQTDIQSLQDTVHTLQDIEKIIRDVVNLVGGCPA